MNRTYEMSYEYSVKVIKYPPFVYHLETDWDADIHLVIGEMCCSA